MGWAYCVGYHQNKSSMKKLLPFLVLLVSCSTVHKVSHTEQKKTDSAAVVSRDSSYKNTTTTQTSGLDVKDLDVTVTYDNAARLSTGTVGYLPIDSINDALARIGPHTAQYPKIKFRPVDRSAQGMPRSKSADAFADLIKQAVSGSGQVAKIEIHVGSISDSATQSVTVDTGSAKVRSDTRVKTDQKAVDKKVDRTGLGLGAKIGIGFALLIGLILLLLYLAKKIHII